MTTEANRDLVRRRQEEVHQNVRCRVGMGGAREPVFDARLAVGAIRIADPMEGPQDDPAERGQRRGDA